MSSLDSGNSWITVVMDDLASLRADAVVRQADADLGPADPTAILLDAMGGDAFALLRRNTTPLEAGAAVVTGGGDLRTPLVLHIVVSDPVRKVGRELLRKGLVSAWQRAGDWGLTTIATPLVGVGTGQLTLQESATLLVETFPKGGESRLQIVVTREADLAAVEAIVRRTT
ncbi:MAG TPA: macro domain-containing protein [Gemmatimonadales bacterium]|jgi:O-acetyl-ADP-ribose deacetylase (regulator of RNase III)